MTAPFSTTALREALDDFFAEPRTEVADKLARYSIDASFGGKVWKVQAAVAGEKNMLDSRGEEEKRPYWTSKVRPKRFDKTLKMGLLYRPEIVNDIVFNIDRAMEGGSGVIVQGSHGVGKSHSLVNVVRKLESTGNYLVTFIPDCGQWDGIEDLYDAMCESFGSTMTKLHFNNVNGNTKTDFAHFIQAVDEILMLKKKTWVFVFDQVMKLLSPLPTKLDLMRLPFPYNQIHHLLERHHRTCVISASANNENAFRDNQSGFTNYNYKHPLIMEKTELRLAFLELQDKSDADLDSIIRLTGGMPWQVYLYLKLKNDKEYLISCRKDNEILRINSMQIDETIRDTLIHDLGSTFPTQVFISTMEIDMHLRTTLINDIGKKFPMPSQQDLDEMYSIEEHKRITASLETLKRQLDPHTWKSIVMSTISCLIQVEVKSYNFDRKYSVLDDPTEGGIYPGRIREGQVYLPVHPLVLEAYVDYFWDDLMDYVLAEEVILLQPCNTTTEERYDTKYQLFKLLVIQRCRLGKIAFGHTNENLPKQSRVVKPFDGVELPRIYNDAEENVTYVPRSSKFPAIDLIWKRGKDVWAVQVQRNHHKTILPMFTQMCVMADWHTEMENVYLVYLSNEREVGDLVCHGLCDVVADKRECPGWTPKVQVLCRMDIACLNELRSASYCTLSPDELESVSIEKGSDNLEDVSLVETESSSIIHEGITSQLRKRKSPFFCLTKANTLAICWKKRSMAPLWNKGSSHE